MARLQIAVSGDQWVNRDAVIQGIADCAGAKNIVFEVNTEGPSLYALGIVDCLLQEIGKIGIDPDSVWIDRWHNAVEIIPFRRAYQPLLSHFFWMSDDYRAQQTYLVEPEFDFALFVGRVTPDRAVIMYELYHSMPHRVLMSLMHENGHHKMLQQSFADWLPDPAEQQAVRQWFHNPPVSSITGHTVRDQYLPGQNTNASLLEHYGKFRVEIVCETYCKGDTFFPTEKTVRPITQGKPMLIYGPKHYLRRLRDLGFQTWGDVWDESYDALQGADRWKAMKQILGAIGNNRLWDHQLMQFKAKVNLSVLDYLVAKHRPGKI